MLDVLSAPRDITRRARLRQLNTTTSSVSTFHVCGWLWHHVALLRDLSLLQTNIQKRKSQLCASSGTATTRQQVLDSLNYILQDNWRIHNFVEHTLFHPWLYKLGDKSLRQNLALFGEERAHLSRRCASLVNAVETWVNTSDGCYAGATRIANDLENVRRDAQTLFGAEESVIIPWVSKYVEEREQRKFNQHVLNKLSPRETRVSLVVFDSAVAGRDRGDFEQQVPKVVRWAVPFWRKRFVGGKNRFIAG